MHCFPGHQYQIRVSLCKLYWNRFQVCRQFAVCTPNGEICFAWIPRAVHLRTVQCHRVDLIGCQKFCKYLQNVVLHAYRYSSGTRRLASTLESQQKRVLRELIHFGGKVVQQNLGLTHFSLKGCCVLGSILQIMTPQKRVLPLLILRLEVKLRLSSYEHCGAQLVQGQLSSCLVPVGLPHRKKARDTHTQNHQEH